MSELFLPLHLALLEGNSQAREDVTKCLLERVPRVLERKMRWVDPSIIADAAEDAILDYLTRPDAYDWKRSRLDTFITLAATRNVIDTLRRNKRKRLAERSFADGLPRISEDAVVANSCLPATLPAWLLIAVTRSEKERRFLLARLRGQRRTAPLAHILGVETGSVPDQRRAVKRVTDKLRIRLRRLIGPSAKTRITR